MAAPKIVGVVEQLWQQVGNTMRKLDEQSHGWIGVVLSAVRDTLKPSSGVAAAALAYFTLFSIFPLILLSISIASFNVDPVMGWQSIFNIYEFIAPGVNQLLGRNIANIIQMRGPITGIALIGLVWSASTIFYTLTQTLSDIWAYKKLRAFWKRRGLAILLVLALVGPALLLASITSSVINTMRNWAPEEILFLAPGVTFIIAILLDIVLLLILYMLLPHGKATWRELLPGAIGAGLLWELAKKAFLLFISTYVDASNLIYGSVAAIIAFLTWAYVSGLIFLFGAYLSLAYLNCKQHRLEASSAFIKKETT